MLGIAHNIETTTYIPRPTNILGRIDKGKGGSTGSLEVQASNSYAIRGLVGRLRNMFTQSVSKTSSMFQHTIVPWFNTMFVD